LIIRNAIANVLAKKHPFLNLPINIRPPNEGGRMR
jgi:hypothetical protein